MRLTDYFDKFILFVSSKLRWKLSNKIMVLILFMLLALLLNGFISISSMQRTKVEFNENFETSVKRSITASNMNDHIMNFDRLIVEHTTVRYEAQRKEIETELIDINTQMQDLILDYSNIDLDDKNVGLIESFEDKWKDYYNTCQIVLDISKTGDANHAMQLWDGWPSIRYTEIKSIIHEMIEYNYELVEDTTTRIDVNYDEFVMEIILVTIICGIVSVLIGLFIVRYLNISVRQMIEANNNLLSGDLSIDTDQEYYGEMGSLFKSNSKVASSLKSMVSEIKGVSKELESASIEYKSGIQEQEKDKAIEGIIALDEASKLMTTFVDTLKSVNDKLDEAISSAENTDKLEDANTQIVQILVKINNKILVMKQFIEDIDEYSAKINVFIEYVKVRGYQTFEKSDKRFELNMMTTLDMLDGLINTIEIIRYGLLDQKINMGRKIKTTTDDKIHTYYLRITESIFDIFNKCEEALFAAKRVANEIREAINDSKRLTADKTDESGVSIEDETRFMQLVDELQKMISRYKL